MKKNYLVVILEKIIKLIQEEKNSEAIQFIENLSKDLKNPDIERYRGVAYAQNGNNKKAKKIFENLIRRYPDFWIVYSNLGNIYLKEKKYTNAIECYNKTIKNCSNYYEAYNNRATALFNIHQYENSINDYEYAINLNPEYSEAISNLAFVKRKLKKYAEAIKLFDKAIEKNKFNVDAYVGKASILAKQENYIDAEKTIDNIPNKNTNEKIDTNLKLELARIRNGLGQEEEAKKLIKEINSITKEDFEYIGNILASFGMADEAINAYRQALILEPHYPEAHHNLSHLLLSLKRFEEAWESYEYRWKTAEFDSPFFLTSKPRWDGQPKTNNLLIWAEQGIGDQVLYSSIFHDLALLPQKKHIILEKKLIPIFERQFPEFIFYEKGFPIPEDNFDEQISIASLGKYFRKNIDDFKKIHYPFIACNSVLTEKITSEIRVSKRLICGLSWKSNNTKVGIDKSIALTDLTPILRINNIDFYDLQYGNTDVEKKELFRDIGIEVKKYLQIDNYNDLDGLLALINACDFVVTTSNTTAHLAGAIGKETYLLLPKNVGKFWYWHHENNQSIWYPSVIVYEQIKEGDWMHPISNILNRIENKWNNQ